MNHPFARLFCLLVVGLCACPWAEQTAEAADPEFVGAMALVADREVARQLGLSDQQYEKLFDWVDDRELAATDLVLSLRGEREELKKQLAAFAAESERLGLAMLTPPQRARLKQIQVAREGMQSLGREDVQQMLKLTEEQLPQVTKLLADRAEAVGKATAAERDAVEAGYERRLAGMLSREQRLAWEKLAGRAADDAVVADAGDPEVDTPTDEPQDDEPQGEAPENKDPDNQPEVDEPAEDTPQSPKGSTDAPADEPAEEVNTELADGLTFVTPPGKRCWSGSLSRPIFRLSWQRNRPARSTTPIAASTHRPKRSI